MEIEFRVRCVTPGSTLYACLEIDAAEIPISPFSRRQENKTYDVGPRSRPVLQLARTTNDGRAATSR